MAEAGDLFLGVFTRECWDVFLDGVDQLLLQFDAVGVLRRRDYYLPCALQVLSKALGYLIILGSLGFKLPQISAIWRSRSAEGLSPASFELDVLVYTASLGYSVRNHFPFSEFGEQAVVLAQNLLLLGLVWLFAEVSRARRALAASLLMAAVGLVAALPPRLLFVLPNVALIASFSSRLPQIAANQKQRHTGQLATSTSALNVAGALARVLTTLAGSRDPVMLFSYATSFVLNATLLAQIFLFRANTRAHLTERLKQH